MGKKILMVGDSPYASSGFARVMREVANGFYNAGHEVKIVGWCYQTKEGDLPYKVYPTLDFKDYYGVQVTRMLIDTWQPDILFTLGDIWMIEWVNKLPERNKVKHIAYFPIDGIPLPQKWISVITDIDIPVVYSKFAYKLVKDAMPFKNIELILHGVDTKTFYELPKDEVEDFKVKLGLENKFVVGNVSRNQWRKNLPALFRGFAEFAEDKDDVVLFYHGAVIDEGWDILEFVDRYDLGTKFSHIKGITPNVALAEKDLNMVYNLFDIFCLPSFGEGFGLPIAESHAVGKPVLVTDFSACSEMAVKEDELIKIKDYTCPSISLNPDKNANIDYAYVDNDSLVHGLNKFYYNRQLGKDIGALGKETVLKDYQWREKIQQFVKLIERD
jgi:D-inositol-3-phosphate glycosyltransferase